METKNGKVRNRIGRDATASGGGCVKHIWSRGNIVEYTGDWFHPFIVERTCMNCGTKITEEE